MLPRASLQDGLNRPSADAVFAGKGPVAGSSWVVLGADADDDFFCQSCTAAAFAMSLPAFAVAIGGIVGVSAEPEMAWVDAARRIAPMQDMHALGDGSVMNLPRESVCPDVSTVDSGLPVAVLRFGSRPQPAIGCFEDLVPEPFSEVAGFACGDTAITTEDAAAVAAAFPGIGRIDAERLAADFASAVNHGDSVRD